MANVTVLRWGIISTGKIARLFRPSRSLGLISVLLRLQATVFVKDLLIDPTTYDCLCLFQIILNAMKARRARRRPPGRSRRFA
jgi:hypothetical protein